MCCKSVLLDTSHERVSYLSEVCASVSLFHDNNRVSCELGSEINGLMNTVNIDTDWKLVGYDDDSYLSEVLRCDSLGRWGPTGQRTRLRTLWLPVRSHFLNHIGLPQSTQYWLHYSLVCRGSENRFSEAILSPMGLGPKNGRKWLLLQRKWVVHVTQTSFVDSELIFKGLLRLQWDINAICLNVYVRLSRHGAKNKGNYQVLMTSRSIILRHDFKDDNFS